MFMEENLARDVPIKPTNSARTTIKIVVKKKTVPLVGRHIL